MNLNHAPNKSRSPAGERGFTLVELMIALLIALFLLAGVVSMLQGTRHTSDNQILLTQLQTNERIAMTLMADVIQQAGYYPDPQTNALASAFPAAPAIPTAPAPAFTQPGQAIIGQTNATAHGDSITIRYQTDASGTVLNCLGQNQDAPGQPHEYTFSVTDSNQLSCAVDGNTPVPLVGNVQSLQILYGVDAVSAATYAGSPANAYVSATDMTAVNWTNLYSVKIIMTFINPLSDQPGQQAAPAITSTRIVSVMGRTGVNVVTDT